MLKLNKPQWVAFFMIGCMLWACMENEGAAQYQGVPLGVPGGSLPAISLGNAVDIDAGVLVAGAPLSRVDGHQNAGLVRIYRTAGPDNWVLETELVADTPAENDRYGWSVAVSGDTVAVGVPLDDDNGDGSGSVYVYRYKDGAWALQAKLTGDDSVAGDAFGDAVALSGDTLLIGAYQSRPAGPISGSAYVFVRLGTAWFQQAKLTASDADRLAYFGESVSVSGDTAVIGASGTGENLSARGAAYVFQRSGQTWSEQARLSAFDAEDGDMFGTSVAVDGETCVVGSFGDAQGGASGSAYVYARSGSAWNLQTKLINDLPAEYDLFGGASSISGDRIVIGIAGDDERGTDSGGAYVYRREGSQWLIHARLYAGASTPGYRFGAAVAVDNDIIAIGAYQQSVGLNVSGVAYVFRPDRAAARGWSAFE